MLQAQRELLWLFLIGVAFLFTLGAMGSGAWCSLLALLALLIGLTRWARARR